MTSKNVQNDLLEAMMISLPNLSQVTAIDISQEDQIRFTWRGDRFVVREGAKVEQAEGNNLIGSNLAILMESVLTRGYLAALDKRDRNKGK